MSTAELVRVLTGLAAKSIIPRVSPTVRSSVLRRSFRKDFPAAVRGEGVYIWDADGNKYLDLAGSAAVNFIGHGVPEISAAMAEQAAKLEFVHTSQFTTPVAEEYAEELLGFAGEHFRGGAVYFTCGGSRIHRDRAETRSPVSSRNRTTRPPPDSQPPAELSRLNSRRVVGLRQQAPPRNVSAHGARVRRTSACPYCYRCDFRLHRRMPQLRPAIRRRTRTRHREHSTARLLPSFSNQSAARRSAQSFLHRDICRAIAEICRRHGVLLIADEVMTGMGRTGRNFAVEHWNIEPDILVTAKGLSSGYAPLGAVIASKKVVDAIAAGSGAFLHGFTYNAHPISLAAGRAVLRHLQVKKLVEAADSNRAGSPAAAISNKRWRLCATKKPSETSAASACSGR